MDRTSVASGKELLLPEAAAATERAPEVAYSDSGAAPGGSPGEANPQSPLVEVEDSDEAQDVRGVPLEASQDGGEAPLEERDAGANDAGPAVGNVAAVQIDADRPPEAPADEHGKFDANAWATCYSVSSVVWFLLNFIAVSGDGAIHNGWTSNSSVFGESCHEPVHPTWSGVVATFVVLLKDHGYDPTHLEVVIRGLIGLSAAALLVAVCACTVVYRFIDKVERYSVSIFAVSSFVASIAGALMLLVCAGVLPPCKWIGVSIILMRFGMTVAGLFGVPLLYGYTRARPHPDQQHLMGGMSIAFVLGELLGFVTGFYLKEWWWLGVNGAVTMCAAIPPMACWKAMKVYGELDRVQANRAADDKFRCNWSFVAMVARSTFIWALIDLPRHVLRCASELFLEKIGDHRFASDMHIIADLGAIVCCIASIAFNIFALPSHAFRRCVSRRLLRNHGTDMVKLGIAGVAVLCALFAIAFLDFLPSPTRSTDIGIPAIPYLCGVALAIEQMLEFLPFLFERREFFVGWTFTVLFRYLIRLALTLYLPKATEDWPSWTIMVIGTATTVVSFSALLQSVYGKLCHVSEDFIAIHKDDEDANEVDLPEAGENPP